MHRIKWASFFTLSKVETSALTRDTQSCTPSRADAMSVPFTIVPPVPTPHSAYLKYTDSTWEEVNLDLGGWLGWELKGSTVEPKSVVSTLWF